MANSNMANDPDGSFHIYVEPKKKLKKIGVPVSYITVTAIIISLVCSQLGV
jgi:hypothetical protein